MGPGRISHSLDWECSVKIKNKFFSARHEDCLPLTAREMEIEGLLSDEEGTEENVDFRFNNPEPSLVETSETRSVTQIENPSFTRQEVVTSTAVTPGESHTIPGAEISSDSSSSQPKTVRGRKGKGKSRSSKSAESEFGLARGTKIQMINADTNEWIPVQINNRVRKGNQKNVEKYNVTIAGYDRQVVDLKLLDWRFDPEVTAPENAPAPDPEVAAEVQETIPLPEVSENEDGGSGDENVYDIRIVDNEVHNYNFVTL